MFYAQRVWKSVESVFRRNFNIFNKKSLQKSGFFTTLYGMVCTKGLMEIVNLWIQNSELPIPPASAKQEIS